MAKMKFKVGDKVRFKKDLEDGKHYGGVTYWSAMDKTKIYVVDGIYNSIFNAKTYSIAAPLSEVYRPWFVTPEMIELAEDTAPTITEHLVRGNKTIVKLSNGKVGIAQCSPEDKFDVYEGLRVAMARAYGREVEEQKKDEPKKEEPKFKVWDRVRYKFFGFGEGTVVKTDSESCSPYLVLFDKPNSDLHDNGGKFPPRCWWCSTDNLEKL